MEWPDQYSTFMRATRASVYVRRLREHLLQDRASLVVTAFPREHQAVEETRVDVTRRPLEMRLQHGERVGAASGRGGLARLHQHIVLGRERRRDDEHESHEQQDP